MRRPYTISLVAMALAIAVGYAGVRWGAMIAGGADSFGYVSQAELWRHGLPIVRQEISRGSPWPGAPETWAPLGYRPSPHVPGAIVPAYPPGLPLLMASLQALAGFCGAFLVVPLCGSLTIWLTFVLGRKLFGAPGVALWGAALVATSPVFLYQLMNAMGDVPVTAFWMLALVLVLARWPLTAGLAASVAIAIRPNLVPLAVVLTLWTAASQQRSHGTRTSVTSALLFAVGVAPAIAFILWLNSTLYESALTSGYGTLGALYKIEYFPRNVRNFISWTTDVETPLVALAALFFVIPSVSRATQVPYARFLIGGLLLVVTGSYAFYQPFDTWWYLRFLLPIWPLLMLLTAIVIHHFSSRLPAHACHALMTTAVIALCCHGLYVAEHRSVFELGRQARGYIDVARFVAAHTEPDAVILSMQHGGALRLYSGRSTLRYDNLDPLWLDRALLHLQSTGHKPYLVLERWEVELFRQRFGAASRAGALDWPPIATLGSEIAVYDALDRNTGLLPTAITSTRRRRSGSLCDEPEGPTAYPLAALK
jgi:hypothetical protein